MDEKYYRLEQDNGDFVTVTMAGFGRESFADGLAKIGLPELPPNLNSHYRVDEWLIHRNTDVEKTNDGSHVMPEVIWTAWAGADDKGNNRMWSAYYSEGEWLTS